MWLMMWEEGFFLNFGNWVIDIAFTDNLHAMARRILFNSC